MILPGNFAEMFGLGAVFLHMLLASIAENLGSHWSRSNFSQFGHLSDVTFHGVSTIEILQKDINRMNGFGFILCHRRTINNLSLNSIKIKPSFQRNIFIKSYIQNCSVLMKCLYILHILRTFISKPIYASDLINIFGSICKPCILINLVDFITKMVYRRIREI